MNGSTPAPPRTILIGALFQIGLAGVLLATGTVRLGAHSPRDGAAIAAGAALGWALFRLLAGPAPAAGRAAGWRTLAGFGTLLIAISVGEEVLWRGFAFHLIAANSGAAAALIVTTAGFAAMHALGQGFAGLRTHAVTGLALGAVLLLTGSLLSAIATHLSYNLMFLRTTRP
jgi:membrane protease YdiL (CAAX protease family)